MGVSRRAPKNVGWGAFANRELRLEEFLANEVEAPLLKLRRAVVMNHFRG